MGFLIVVGWLSTLGSLLSLIFKRKFSDLLFPITNTCILILYFGGLVNNLKMGFFICIISSIVICIYFLYALLSKKILLSNPIRGTAAFFPVLFILLGIWCFLSSRNMCVWNGDDLAHWALAPKEMYYKNTFAPFGDSLLSYKAYPPASSLWLYFGEILNGQFSDDILFMMNQMLVFIVLSFLFKKIEQKGFLGTVFLLIITILFPLIFYYGNIRYTLYSTLHVDGLMGLYLGYIISLWYTSDNSLFNRINMYLACACLALMKETGLLLVIMVNLIFLIDLYIRKEKIKKHYILQLIWGVLSAFLAFSSWKIYLMIWHINVSTPLKSSFSFGTLLDSLIKNTDVIKGFFHKLFSIQTFGIIKISYPIALLIICIGILIYAFKKKVLLKRVIINLVCYLTMGIIWELGILHLYLFKFTESERSVYISFERYSLTFIYALCYVALIMLLEINQFRNLWIGIVAAIIYLSIPQYVLANNLINNNRVNQTLPSRTQLGIQVPLDIFEITDKVYIIDQDRNWQKHSIYLNCLYQIYPVQANKMFFTGEPGDYRVSYQLGKPIDDNDIQSTDLTSESWSNILQEYTYVYIAGYDARFQKQYGKLFADKICNNTLYYINHNNGNIKLYRK